MALSPAEKQRRYRARLRERLEVAKNSVHPDDLDVLREAIRSQCRADMDALREENARLRAELARLNGQ